MVLVSPGWRHLASIEREPRRAARRGAASCQTASQRRVAVAQQIRVGRRLRLRLQDFRQRGRTAAASAAICQHPIAAFPFEIDQPGRRHPSSCRARRNTLDHAQSGYFCRYCRLRHTAGRRRSLPAVSQHRHIRTVHRIFRTTKGNTYLYDFSFNLQHYPHNHIYHTFLMFRLPG